MSAGSTTDAGILAAVKAWRDRPGDETQAATEGEVEEKLPPWIQDGGKWLDDQLEKIFNPGKYPQQAYVLVDGRVMLAQILAPGVVRLYEV